MVMAGVTAFIIAINLYGHASYLSKINSNSPLERPPWTQSFEELETMLKWIDRNVPKDAVLAAAYPPLVYLYTGNKTIAPYKPRENWDNWNRMGVRYLVRASLYPDSFNPADLKYKVVYHSRSELNFSVIDLGDPNNRPAWGEAGGK
jgi:hypothetical protein